MVRWNWVRSCRLNAIRLEEKEKKEREMLRQIIEEAEEYKIEFYKKCSLAVENNKASNREKEKVYCLFDSLEKQIFHSLCVLELFLFAHTCFWCICACDSMSLINSLAISRSSSDIKNCSFKFGNWHFLHNHQDVATYSISKKVNDKMNNNHFGRTDLDICLASSLENGWKASASDPLFEFSLEMKESLLHLTLLMAVFVGTSYFLPAERSSMPKLRRTTGRRLLSSYPMRFRR